MSLIHIHLRSTKGILIIDYFCVILYSLLFGLYVVLHGLLPAMDELLTIVEQRFCVRYIYNNFRKRYS